jgi:O-antigen ligase
VWRRSPGVERWRAGAIWAASVVAALILAVVIVRRGAAAGLAVALLPAVGYALTRRLGALLFAIAIILIVPFWRYLGPVHSIRIAVGLAVLAWLVAAQRPRLTWIDVTLAAFVVVSVLSWYLQDDQPAATRVFSSEFLPLTFFLAARSVAPRRVPRVMAFTFLAGGVGALTVLYEAVLGHLAFGQSADTYLWNPSTSTVFRPGGIFGSPPGAATVLAMTATCGLPVLRDWRGWRRLAGVACMAVTLVAIVATFTRAPVVGFVAAVGVYLIVSRSSLLTPARIVVALLVVVLGVAFVLPRLESNSLFQKGIVRGGTFAARTDYWGLALPIITANAKNLIVGVGIEATAVRSVGGSAPPDLAATPELTTNGTHNQYVLALLEQGIVGLAALVAWLGVSIVSGIRSALARPDPFAAALPAAIVALAIVMLADNALQDGPTMAVVGLITGLIVARRGRAGILRSRATRAYPASRATA